MEYSVGESSVVGSTAHRGGEGLEPKHKIFLSHSGAQKGFVQQLCLDLERSNRYPFFDIRRDSLPIGKNFPNLIFDSIKHCEVGVLILSEEYFTRSKWPMLELDALVKAKKLNDNLTIIPVFLGISRDRCRDQVNPGRWFSRWRGWISVWHRWAQVDSRINIQDWKKALEILVPTNALFSKDGLCEVNCREEIVDAVCMLVPPETKWDVSYVQGRARLCKVIREKIDEKHELSASYGVHVVGLFGVGGIGKTTACKALCNELFKTFRGKVCHVEFESANDLDLLKNVLKSLTDSRLPEGFGVDQCRDRLRKDMQKQKVFLAIDNVADATRTIDLAKTLLRAGYKVGSVVLVTARSLGQLQLLNIRERECIEMPELKVEEAKSLFLYHATPGSEDLKNDYRTERCLERCQFKTGVNRYQYHPLALKVLGIQLGSEVEEWTIQLNDLDTFNQLREKEHPIFSILRKSFDTLLDDDQQLFMDIALFSPEVPGEKTSKYWKQINIFEWLSMVHKVSEADVKRRLKILERKSLLENLGDGSTSIGMHDLWREFCVLQSKAGDSNCPRWVHEELDLSHVGPEVSILSGGGWKNMQRMCLSSMIQTTVMEVNLSKCSNLVVFKSVNLVMEDNLLDLSVVKRLKSLELWTNNRSKGPTLEVRGLGSLRHLLVLRMDGIPNDSSCIEEIGSLTNLQVLQLECRAETNKLPDLGRLSLLREVTCARFSKACTISSFNSNMTTLRYLCLSGCESLQSCPGVDSLLALEELDLSDCKNLKELPSLRKLKCLQRLDIMNCHLIKAVRGLDGLAGLKKLLAFRCYKLAKLPKLVALKNLQELDIRWCGLDEGVRFELGLSDLIALQVIRANFGQAEDWLHLHKLTKLQEVDIWNCDPEGLLCVAKLANLEQLQLNCCTEVDDLAADLLNLTRLQSLVIDVCNFKAVSGVSNLTTLQSLQITGCGDLESLPNMEKLIRLETLYISICSSLSVWEGVSRPSSLGVEPYLPSLQSLKLINTPITELPDLNAFPCLKDLELYDCGSLTNLTSSGPLTTLENLEFHDCGQLSALPDFSGSKRLRWYQLENCGVQLNAHEIENLKAMCPDLTLKDPTGPDSGSDSDSDSSLLAALELELADFHYERPLKRQKARRLSLV